MIPTKGESDESPDPGQLSEYTLEGKWKKVIKLYKDYPECHRTKISESEGTALHVAIDLNEEKVVKELLEAILTYHDRENEERTVKKRSVRALRMGNERRDTPLHVAASRGFTKICMMIIGTEKERIYLTSKKNKDGETPLFQAAIYWHKHAFAYLSAIFDHHEQLQYLVRKNGDTILHCAIKNEYFDLAVIIVHYYDFLVPQKNKEGLTPLTVLATRPSAFGSGNKFSWWRQILYHCIPVKRLDPEEQMKKFEKMEKGTQCDDNMKYPMNYATFYDFFSGSSGVASVIGERSTKNNVNDTENPGPEVGFLPPNYETFQQFVRSAYVHALALSGVELKKIRKTKKRHQWSGQLLMGLLKRPYAALTGSGGVPIDMGVDSDMYGVYDQYEVGETSEGSEEESETGDKLEEEANEEEALSKTNQTDQPIGEGEKKNKFDKKETAFLVAARNGIVEMVNELLHRIPSVIYNTNSKKENVLLLAVLNRQPLVVQCLKMKTKQEVWNNLILGVDNDERTMLHLAAYAPGGHKPWQIAGSAMQMMWDIKWFQYIKSLVPQHIYFRSNKDGKIAREIFEDEHKVLVDKSSEWLRETSESCSVVAALVAGVSFATASSIPGGTNDEGKPNLEGKTAFDAFAIASLIGLFFSVNGLIMFLTILTSRKQAKDFRKGLPLKLLFGLSSLFISIVAMFVSFCTGHFFLLSHKYKMVLYPIYVATCFPVTFYAVAQFPLYIDLVTAILIKVPRTRDKADKL